ncbi:bifunctional tRNA (5-methylaminomethyl-2-thiouridine)(34)-methyltransferase MnmD/FAD-dependent 5-carboxymethylaminomethyl-2-thiouridine(34) oxidoreductase MnmC [Legionella maceachernii]|uniref:tRNA 5-methylaminomethyl-2-thiouridine biosynthesis bifunctional protein MnmC n=1 Tax=Legionella maceachernii TaxID=466 RepID=A0A0W0W8X0_9GAMM|nr:bifunctional tRNA (5-methylaminomethyl-2-thiouridine)(34)-methyltransferase MnmD/FAD-dependent 5-carboxymethylaminomethyl-2-thiouridine(34) oxidoreductase MnmC [Legionella maceachernii]KTD28792.1 FAD dependent oxidoreductase [Legionella maceachernii]SJZ71139.1 tRNA 5-methylaminomethyl-2-thiouridine biosynthesis bifunctional protein [Legionella maceachernii]SUP02335.1 tRNA 5-methylaminomethyl-2-thiouridine biosynthesis bifunctional protein MnmC [Legionella maceachernii]
MSSSFVPIEAAKISWCDELPFSLAFDDIYFSKENGLAETRHVFIEGNNLIERWQNLTQETFVIAETGFGSGLNFLLTWSLWLEQAPQSARLHFFSCEKFPLTKNDLQRCLKQWPALKRQASALIDNYPILTPGFHWLSFEAGRINLILMLGDATACYKQLLVCGDAKLERELRTNSVDAWFLDGFSPAKNPAMWSDDLLQIIGLLSKPGTTLATFSAAASVKNNLQAAGFNVDKVRGFGSKREMITAQFVESSPSNKKLRCTPWHVNPTQPAMAKKAIVLGAGLAGCYTAHALAKRGWQVSLIDAHNEVGQGASGNKQAVLYPKLSAYRSPLTQFMLTAFLFACRTYRRLLNKKSIGELSGILQFAFNERESAAQQSLGSWLSSYPELGRLVDAQQASTIAGIELTMGGLYIPYSGWMDSQALCEQLCQTPGIDWYPNTLISELHFEEKKWHVGEHLAEVLVIANGYQAKQFIQTAHLPLKAIRGQMTRIASNKASTALKIPLCGNGHVLPAYGGGHAIGASYHLDSTDRASYSADDVSNLNKLSQLPASIAWSLEIKDNWVGVRATTTDYLPMVGPVPDPTIFPSRFAALATNAKRWIPEAGAFLPGLFLCTGFGSRGLTTVPLSAEWLAALINNEPSFLPQAMVQSLSPARFLLKAIIKNLS